MIGNDIAKLIFKKVLIDSTILNEANKNSGQSNSVKELLIDESEYNSYEILDNSTINIEVDKDSYASALVYDYRSNIVRIEEQNKNTYHLLKSNAQVAWVIVTMYYSNYFMANELSKLYGNFIINLPESTVRFILHKSDYQNSKAFAESIQQYNSYRIEVNQSDYESKLLLKFTKSSPKPHQVVWHNLSSILSKMEVSDSLFQHYDLLLSILDGNRGWAIPSIIRNEWNYSSAKYYGKKGDELAQKFIQLANKPSSAFGWGNDRRVQPHEHNKVASIAYIFHVLEEAFNYINSRLADT